MQLHSSTFAVSSETTTAFLEDTIDRGKKIMEQTFLEIGTSLAELRRRKSYEEQGFKTFEAYIENRFGFTRQQADYLMSGANTFKELDTILPAATPRPIREAQVRPLRQLARENPVVAAEVWTEVVEEHGPKATAPQVREVVERRAPVVTVREKWSPPRHDERFRFPRMALELLSLLNGPSAREGAEILRQSRPNANETADLLISLRNRLEEYIDALQRED